MLLRGKPSSVDGHPPGLGACHGTTLVMPVPKRKRVSAHASRAPPFSPKVRTSTASMARAVPGQLGSPAFVREEDQLRARLRLMPAGAPGESNHHAPQPALPQCHALSCPAARGGRLHCRDDAQAERREDAALLLSSGIGLLVCHERERQRRPTLTIAPTIHATRAGARVQQQAGARHLARVRGSRRASRACAFCEFARRHVGAGWTLAAHAFAQIQARAIRSA